MAFDQDSKTDPASSASADEMTKAWIAATAMYPRA
jgi:hypothetical protein